MTAQAERLVRDRANEVIAAILHHKERFVDPALDDDTAARLRSVVLREVNAFKEFTVEILRSLDTGPAMVLNEDLLRKLNDIHDAVVGNGVAR